MNATLTKPGDPPPAPTSPSGRGLPRKFRLGALLALAVLVVGALGVWFGRGPGAGTDGQAEHGTARRIKGNPGPWGELEYIPILIETPDEYLSVGRQAAFEATWSFRNYPVSGLAELFNGAGLSPGERSWLLDQRNWRAITNGFAISPPPEMLMGLSRASRERIYAALAECGGNPLQEMPLSYRLDGLDDWFYKSGLSAPTIAMTKSLLYQRGNAWCLSDWPLLLRYTESPAEQRRLLKTTSRQRTLVPRLRIRPDADVERLAGYWGRGGRLKDIRPLLQSLTRLPDGITVDVIHLLPRFVRARIFTYPPPAGPDNKPIPNSFWTSMNFFANDGPDDRFQDPEEMKRTLAEQYFPVDEDYLLGDVLLLGRPDGTIVHASVFVADDVVLTKSGLHLGQPWMFARLDDLTAMHPSVVPSKLRGYRRKDL